jgi:hypothetical protein
VENRRRFSKFRQKYETLTPFFFKSVSCKKMGQRAHNGLV